MQRAGGTPLTDDGISDADFEAAMAEPVILAAQRSNQWRFPQFVWQVRRELTTRLCARGGGDLPRDRGAAASP